ncbi:MAG: 16S rRNA (cytosine(1402)-N(4))-methyltransferase, partial [Gammaproteobacteria bacterium]
QYPAGLPIQETELNKKISIIGKAQKASAEEVEQNQRARSAVLRVAERI